MPFIFSVTPTHLENVPCHKSPRRNGAAGLSGSEQQWTDANQSIPRESLSALLWPDYDQVKAFTNLRHTLWEIQKSLGPGWLIADRETISLHADANVWVDVHQFESLLSESQAQSDISLRIPL